MVATGEYWPVEALSTLDIPATFTIGKADNRLGPQWLRILEESGLDVIVVEGANHVFDHLFEVDLFNVIGDPLARVPDRSGT